MDRELAQLQKETIKRLIEYEDELQALGDVNQLKKTRRVSSSVAINIAAFPDLIQNLLDSGVETAEITRKLRNFQEALLRDTVVIKGTETGHHGSQLRTGGSFYRADPKIWQNSVSRLADFFGTQFGDVPENIKSYINYVHKSDTNTKGIEAEVLGKTANPYKELTAHPMGTGPKSIIGNLTPEELSDPDKFFDAMAKRVDVQFEANKIADKLQRPLVETVQKNIDPRAYNAPDVPTNLEIQQKILLPENRPIIEKGILEVVQEAGHVRMALLKNSALNFHASFLPGAEELGKAIVKNPVEALTGAALTLADPDVIKSLFQGNPKEAVNKAAFGAAVGAGIAETLKVSPMQQARLTSFASKVPGVASKIPAALNIASGVAKFATPVAMAVGGAQLADAILEGSTGSGFVDTIKQVQDKERTAEINRAAVESAKKSKQLAAEREAPKPIIDSDTIEKFATDPLNELEWGWKKLTGQV